MYCNPTPSLNPPLSQGISATGSTSNYISRHNYSSCINILPQNSGNSLCARHTFPRTICNFPRRSHPRKPRHRFPNFHWKLCDDDFIAIFTKYHVKTIKYRNLIILGNRNPTNSLSNIPIASKTSSSPTSRKNESHCDITSKNTKSYIAAFFHGYENYQLITLF